MIDLLPNLTVVWQWLIFMGTLAVLTYGVFRPTLRLLEARRDRIAGERGRAERLQRESQALLTACEEKLEEARRTGIREKEVRRQEGEKIQTAILAQARAETEGILTSVRGEIDQATLEASMKIRQYSQDLSREIAAKILERPV